MEMSEQPATPSKYAGLGAELMIDLWFDVGVMQQLG